MNKTIIVIIRTENDWLKLLGLHPDRLILFVYPKVEPHHDNLDNLIASGTEVIFADEYRP